MAKRLTTAEKIRRYMEAHPDAMPKQIAEALGVKASYIHVLRSSDKKRIAEGKPIRRIKRTYARKIGLVPPTNTEDNIGFGLKWVQQTPADAPSLDIPAPQNTLAITMIEPKADPVNHPAHYKVGGVETIDFIEAKQLNYNLGDVVKYITRADHKGNRKQDLEKALWYLKREVEAQNA